MALILDSTFQSTELSSDYPIFTVFETEEVWLHHKNANRWVESSFGEIRDTEGALVGSLERDVALVLDGSYLL